MMKKIVDVISDKMSEVKNEKKNRTKFRSREREFDSIGFDESHGTSSRMRLETLRV